MKRGYIQSLPAIVNIKGIVYRDVRRKKVHVERIKYKKRAYASHFRKNFQGCEGAFKMFFFYRF